MPNRLQPCAKRGNCPGGCRAPAAVGLLSGPGFVVGCIGGQLFGSVALGLLLYGLQLAANLAAAACLVLFLPKQELPAGQGSSQQKSVTFPQAISNAVQSSLTVCGCAVFCRVVGSVLGQGMPDGARPYLNAALEISAGCADFAAAGSVAGVCLCLSLLGASVLAQLAALLQGTVPLGCCWPHGCCILCFCRGCCTCAFRWYRGRRLCSPVWPRRWSL